MIPLIPFNKFYKTMRNTKEYDSIIELKENDIHLKKLTSKGVFAMFYANDLYEHGIAFINIIKLFEGEFKKIVTKSLMERLQLKSKKKLRVKWSEAVLHIKTTVLYNDYFTKDSDYFDAYYPVRMVK